MEDKRTVLIVDDEARLREMLHMILENRHYKVLEATNGQEAINIARDLSPDLILMDVMMPIMDGLISCKKIREFSKCPIIMLTAKGEDYDQVNGFESGVDDYIIKPFTPMVLVARVEAALRRTVPLENQRLNLGLLMIDPKGRDVFIEGKKIEVNRKEYELLVYLSQNINISLSRDQILEKVWGYDYLGSESTVDTHINRIRKKLGICESYIKTIRGYGYKLEVSHEE